jgi:hypothetical protein
MELAVAASGGGPAAWVAILVASIAAGAAVIAAIVAAASARSTKQLELQAQRTRDLESRISERKAEVYKPMIDMLGTILSAAAQDVKPSPEKVQANMREFATWIIIYGSEDAIKAYHNFTQAAFAQAPGLIATRLYAEFILAARRDLGYPETSVTAMEIMGMRVTDLYSEFEYRSAMTQTFEELCQRERWTPPWLTVPSLPRPDSSPSSS